MRFKSIIELLSGRYSAYKHFKKELGYLDSSAHIDMPDSCSCPSKIFLYKNTCIRNHSRFIISKYGDNGKFIMKDNSGAAVGLTVITGNHNNSFIGDTVYTSAAKGNDVDKDMIVNEDVWIGANVTLTCGTELGRGCIIAAGSVVIGQKIPPYAIAAGNPCKVIGYRFTPEQIIKHESLMYPEDKRLPFQKLQKNYQKYFDNRENVADYLSLY